MKNILVIGGAGFIGYNLCNKLLEDPNNFVSVIDNLITGQKKNINKLLQHPRCEFLNCDINDRTKLDMFFSISTINEIYHLASIASPEKYKKYMQSNLSQNTETESWQNLLFKALVGLGRTLEAGSYLYRAANHYPNKIF